MKTKSEEPKTTDYRLIMTTMGERIRYTTSVGGASSAGGSSTSVAFANLGDLKSAMQNWHWLHESFFEDMGFTKEQADAFIEANGSSACCGASNTSIKDIDESTTPMTSRALKPNVANGKLVKSIANGPISLRGRAQSSEEGEEANGGDEEAEAQSRRACAGSPMVELVVPSADAPLVKIQARKVNCKSVDGELFVVDWYLMQQSKHFKRMWDEHRSKKKGTNGRSRKFTFHADNVDADTFRRVLQWLVEHDGMDDPVVREDPITGDRVWFELTDFERRFFEVPVYILNDLLNAGKSLDIPSLYLYGCQSMAALIQNKTPAEIRDMLGLENDLTSTDIAMIKRKNRKSKMRELKAVRYASRLHQLQAQLQQLEWRKGPSSPTATPLARSGTEQLLLAGLENGH